MSSAEPPVSATGVGLGYGIAIAVSFLVLISTIMLASYICVRLKISSSSSGSTTSHHLDDQDVIVHNYRYQLHHQLRRDNSSSELAPEAVAGLDPTAINSLPKIVVGESRRIPRPNNGPCSICLADYRANDTLRCIPDCNHCFHADCVDEWLRVTATCPLCRVSPAPTPVASPLSELVPLAVHVAR